MDYLLVIIFSTTTNEKLESKILRVQLKPGTTIVKDDYEIMKDHRLAIEKRDYLNDRDLTK
jgi:hypothetical protein